MILPLLFAIFVKIICLVICFHMVNINSNGLFSKTKTDKDENDEIYKWYGLPLLATSGTLAPILLLGLLYLYKKTAKEESIGLKICVGSLLYLFVWLVAISAFIEYQNNNVTDEKFKSEEYIRFTNSMIFISSLILGCLVGYIIPKISLNDG